MKREGEDKFTFGDIFRRSFKEYTGNFREIFKFIFLFVGIPALLLTIIQIVMLIVDPNLFAMMSTPELLAQLDAGTLKMPLYYTLVNAFFSIISVFLMIFMSAGLISTTLKKSKFSLNELISNAKSRYWKYFGFCIVVGIFILLLTLIFLIPASIIAADLTIPRYILFLTLPLLIPTIIFVMYWIFASYVFFDKKEKIIPSLKQSKAIVKDRWWKTFGYLFLIGLILIGFSIVMGIIQLPTLIIMMIKIFKNTPLSIGLLIVSSLLNLISSFIGSLVAAPFSVLFLKNFYLEMKK
jgi:hypothetical protein